MEMLVRVQRHMHSQLRLHPNLNESRHPNVHPTLPLDLYLDHNPNLNINPFLILFVVRLKIKHYEHALDVGRLLLCLSLPFPTVPHFCFTCFFSLSLAHHLVDRFSSIPWFRRSSVPSFLFSFLSSSCLIIFISVQHLQLLSITLL